MSDEPSAFFPADNPAALAHVSLLQGVISRLAGNSASCKTWCLTLVGALLSLAAAAHSPPIAEIALIPVILLGLLDAMYLAQERAYRDLFGRVVTSMRDKSYALPCVFEVEGALRFGGFFSALFSWSVWPLYMSLVGLYVAGLQTGALAQLAAVMKQ